MKELLISKIIREMGILLVVWGTFRKKCSVNT